LNVEIQKDIDELLHYKLKQGKQIANDNTALANSSTAKMIIIIAIIVVYL
jgi:hypothetical protein